MNRRLKIAVLHPYLGLGGAERLIVDAAIELQAAGHRVTVFTTHHDPERSFEVTRDGRLDIRVHGNFLPRAVGQRLRAPCTIARMGVLACAPALRANSYDVVLCDLVAHIVPLVRRRTHAKVVFYCHFPDRLLAPQRGALYRMYRIPIDRMEEWGLRLSHRVLVNSQFTAACFRRSFSRLAALPLDVVYPGVELEVASGRDGGAASLTIACIGRFAPEKNQRLAIQAMAALRERIAASVFADVRLVIAGGYDQRLREQRGTLYDLQRAAAQHGLSGQIDLRCSPHDAERAALLSACRCVVYTPMDEHFGLVPVEAMAAAKPVVAVDSGGVRETVCHERTGLLCPPTPDAFADSLARLLTDDDLARRMGREGRARAEQLFSRAAFGGRLEAILHAVAG